MADDDRARRLLDAGYRLRWWANVALVALDIAALVLFATLGYNDRTAAIAALLVWLNVVGLAFLPHVAAPPTANRLTAERVLRVRERRERGRSWLARLASRS